MLEKKINQFEHPCCGISPNKDFSICKECSKRGESVKEITLKNLVKEPKLEDIKNPGGFYFCKTATCNTVYFNNEQHIYLHKEDVKARVGIKETECPVPVCYCFGWTRERIFDQIRDQGESTAFQEITARVKAGECDCWKNNPSGRCCLGEVNKVVKNGMELYGKRIRTKSGKLRNLPVVGSIISAIAASICCIGPVVLAILGIGGAGFFSKFEGLRQYFIVITFVLLGLTFYLTYKKREALCEDGTCKIRSAGKWNKIAVLAATTLVVFFLVFPYLHLSNHNPTSNQVTGEIVETAIHVEGMTCSGCEFNVENAVNKLKGIIQVRADYQHGKVYVKYEKEKVTLNDLKETIRKAGYRTLAPNTMKRND
ncbi:MAG: mercuric transporter MerT family protein [Firmicutes bacterium]|nr:mercuric transporter MerT family protein [Bacillota bacterium]